MKSKRRQIEAWAVVRGAEAEIVALFDNGPAATRDVSGRHMHLSNNIRVVRLVEASPSGEKVLRAVMRYFQKPCVGLLLRLQDANSAHQKAKRKKQ